MLSINLRGSGTQESIAKSAQQEALKSAKHRGVLDVSRMGYERDLKEAIKGVEALAKAVKEIRREMATNFNLELTGTRRVFQMKQDERREEERELRRRQQVHRRFLRAASLGGAAGAIGGGAASGNLGAVAGGFGGAIGGGLGFLLGGPIGAAIGDALGASLGFLINPLKGPVHAAIPWYNYQLQAATLGRAMGTPWKQVQQGFYPHHQLLPWEYKYGLDPKEALQMAMSLGVTPQGNPMAIAHALTKLPYTGALSGLNPSSLNTFIGTAMGAHAVGATGTGTYEAAGSLERVMEVANARGFDRSRLLQSMQRSLQIMSQGGFGVNLAGMSGLYTGISSMRNIGAAGGGSMASDIIAGSAGVARNPYTNKLLMLSLMSLLPKYGNFKTAADVESFMGGMKIPPSIMKQILEEANVQGGRGQAIGAALALMQGNPTLIAHRALQGLKTFNAPGTLRGTNEAAFINAMGLTGGNFAAAMTLVGEQSSPMVRTLSQVPVGKLNTAASYFERLGYSKKATAGILANMVAESGMNPAAIGDHGLAYGLFQWHPARQALFKKWAGHSIQGSSFMEQLRFIAHELNTTESTARHELLGVKTPYEAGSVMSMADLRPLHKNMDAAIRGKLAQRIFSNFLSGLNAPENVLHQISKSKTGTLNEAYLAAKTLVTTMSEVNSIMQTFGQTVEHINKAAEISHPVGVYDPFAGALLYHENKALHRGQSTP